MANVHIHLHGEALWNEYVVARSCWRTWAQKPTRQLRRVLRRQSRHNGLAGGDIERHSKRSRSLVESEAKTSEGGSVYKDYAENRTFGKKEWNLLNLVKADLLAMRLVKPTTTLFYGESISFGIGGDGNVGLHLCLCYVLMQHECTFRQEISVGMRSACNTDCYH